MSQRSLLDKDLVDRLVDDLILLQDEELGFWLMDQSKKDPYRGILHSAQPLIALAEYMIIFPKSELNQSITQ